MESFYHRQGEDLSQIDDDEINGEAIFELADNDQYYQVLLPEPERRNLFVEVSHNINENVSIPSSLLYFFNGDRLIEQNELSHTIDQNIERKFGDKSLDLTESVVTRFMQKYPFSDGQIRLQQILDEADVLLPLNTSDRYFINDSDKTKQMIGFKLTDDRENKQFRDLITQEIGINADVIIPLQTKNEIVIIKEFSGFPLRIVNGLKELREQYERQKKLYDGYNLHNDYETFFLDIIPPDAREMEILQDLFYTCLAFDKISKFAGNNNYYLECEDKLRNSTYQVEISGVWEEAMEEISQNPELQEYLEAELKQQPYLFEQIYQPHLFNFVDELDKLTEYDINFTQKKIVLGERASRSTLGSDGILSRIYDKFTQIVNEAQQSLNIHSNPQLPSDKTNANQPLLKSASDDNNLNNASAINSNEIIEADLWDGNNNQAIKQSSNNTEKIDPVFYDKWKDITPRELLELKKEGILSSEEVQKIKKYILGL